jgi:predicted NUDIX family NTP pyrophosphohydrolase
LETVETRVQRMAKKSAGILMYRFRETILEVFLVHPGGPFWARKDAGAWSIPKGEFGGDEDALTAARREFAEETGFSLVGEFITLTPLRQPSSKVIHAWAVEGDCDLGAVKSNTFSMEWPARSGEHRDFPEVDRAGWFSSGAAKVKIIKGQVGFVEELEKFLMGPEKEKEG